MFGPDGFVGPDSLICLVGLFKSIFDALRVAKGTWDWTRWSNIMFFVARI